ncbi:MAG: GGDEF domain-containing protein [Armatimonadota bacterium]
MDKDSTKNIDASPNTRVSAGLVMCLVCAAGLGCIISALFSSGLEWRILSIAALAAAANPFAVEIHGRWKDESIRFSLTHCVLFAGALALGPFGASLPAALGAAVRLAVENPAKRPLHLVLYEILKPAAVCSLSSCIYVVSGGNEIRPQQADSFAPLLCAAIVYIGANAFLAAITPKSKSSEPVTEHFPNAFSVAAGWSLCIFSGYALAVLYAIAPSYVLLALSVPAALACGALFARPKQQLQPRKTVQEEQKPDLQPQRKSGSAFVDPVTGLANKRYLEMFLQNELSRSERAERPLSVAVFDLDEFKNNPKKKDESAREAMVAMGEKLKSEVRDYDLVANYSATRLVAVFPEAPAQEAEEIVQRLHDSVANAGLKERPLSVSVGISTFPEHGSTPEDIINAAHRALNQGRFLGPNLVHSFRELQKAS